MIKRIYIEITNRCNLKCAFCIDHNRKYQDMNINDFIYILDSIKNITDYIYLHVQGEPLLHPDLYALLDEIEKRQLKVQLVTNASLIKDNIKLTEYNCLRKISFSLHSIDYQFISVEEYMNNIFNFINNAKYPYIELRFWRKDKLSAKAKSCLELIYKRYKPTITSKPNSYKLDSKLFLHFDNEFTWPSKIKEDSYTSGTCLGAKTMLAILVNGDVVPCCLDAKGEIILGNIFNNTIEEIMDSPRYKNIIKGFNDRKIEEPLCQKCTYRLRFNKN